MKTQQPIIPHPQPPPQRPRSAILHAAIATTKAMIERIDVETLPSLDSKLDALASAESWNSEEIEKVTQQKSEVMNQRGLLLRRIELLNQQREEALKEEGELRIPIIVEELTAQSEETETLRRQWETALNALIQCSQAFLPLAQRRQTLLDESEFLRLSYALSPLPPIAPLALPAATELKALTEVLVSLRGPFVDPWAQRKLELREEQRLSAPPVPLDVRTQPGLVLEIEHPPAPAQKSFDTSRYQVGEVHIQGMPRPATMAEKKLS